jgi:hypothetical protein
MNRMGLEETNPATPDALIPVSAIDRRKRVYRIVFIGDTKGARMRQTVAGVAALMCTAAHAATEPPVFEKPAKISSVALPPDSYNPTFKHTRICYYYRGTMVKEVNYEDEKGAHRLSLVPISLNEKPPACNADNAREIVISKWSGYYLGKRGAAFFFDADDGINGGMPFVAYTAFGNQILEDSSELTARKTIRSVRMDATALVVRYRRAWLAPCSLYADPAACWTTIMAQTGIVERARPNCRALYEAEMKRTSKYAADIAKSQTMIGYEVEARTSQGKTSFTALPGRVTCWLED